jgi:TM2 domain-containing membrane protein YozV
MMNPPAAPTKFCHACGQSIDARAEICPHCGVRQAFGPATPSPAFSGADTPELRDAGSKKLAAGICAILIGALGIHKFIIGATNAGIITIIVTLVTCGVGGAVMAIIGIIEGVIYLTRSDEEFYQTYVVQKKAWF